MSNTKLSDIPSVSRPMTRAELQELADRARKMNQAYLKPPSDPKYYTSALGRELGELYGLTAALAQQLAFMSDGPETVDTPPLPEADFKAPMPVWRKR